MNTKPLHCVHMYYFEHDFASARNHEICLVWDLVWKRWLEKDVKCKFALFGYVFSWRKECFARASYKDTPQRRCQAGKCVLAWLQSKGVCIFTGRCFKSLPQWMQNLFFRSSVPVNHWFECLGKTDTWGRRGLQGAKPSTGSWARLVCGSPEMLSV